MDGQGAGPVNKGGGGITSGLPVKPRPQKIFYCRRQNQVCKRARTSQQIGAEASTVFKWFCERKFVAAILHHASNPIGKLFDSHQSLCAPSLPIRITPKHITVRTTIQEIEFDSTTTLSKCPVLVQMAEWYRASVS